jgi:rhamnosyltransferase
MSFHDGCPQGLNYNRCAVILAVYNGMQYLEEQIASILNQRDSCLTIFVSVDLSSDGSEIWLTNLAKQDPRVVMLPYGEKFGGAARNFFRLIRDVDFSQFDYVAFADQDDHWYPDKLCKAIAILNTGQYDGYSSNVIAFWPNGRQKVVHKSQPQRRWDYIFEAAGPGCTYVMSISLMKATKARVLEVWDSLQEVKAHDWYCYAFARANGYQWFIDAKPSMLYRQHEKNQFGVNLGIKSYLKRFKLIRNGYWLRQVLLIVELVGIGHSTFAQTWAKLGRIELLRLATQAFQCRRDFKEQVIFMLICLMLATTGEQQRDYEEN